MFETSGWSLSSPLRGSFENVEEFHVRLDKGMFLQDELKRFTKDLPYEVRFVRKAHRIVFLLTSQQSPFSDQVKQ